MTLPALLTMRPIWPAPAPDVMRTWYSIPLAVGANWLTFQALFVSVMVVVVVAVVVPAISGPVTDWIW